MSHTTREKTKLLNRVRRIRGQMEAVERALEEERGCAEVLQLIAGVRGAINGLMADPQLPFFIQWEIEPDLHPSTGADESLDLACLEIAGDPQRVSEWLGEPVEAPLEDVKVEWVAPHGTPGIIAVQVLTPNGLVRL